jgi:hypothetical protein
MRRPLLLLAALFHLTIACAQLPSVTSEVAVLSDSPAATFNISGWSYTNTTNPFLLTPDSLTNAMVGVSRLPKGSRILRSSVVVPASLDISSIQVAMAERLRDKSQPTITTEKIGDRQVVVARYTDRNAEVVEYAFEFANHMVLVLLRAKSGPYFRDGAMVARKVVESFASP